MWLEEIDYAYKRDGYLSLTLHPQCIDREARIKLLEGIIRELLKRRAWIPRAVGLARKLYR